MFADLETDFEDGLEEYAGFIATTLWQITAGDWKSINSRVKHFNRLLGSRLKGQRILTRAIVEQVLDKKDGPADLVIEVTSPGHEAQDTHYKQQCYAAAHVPEYWIVDLIAKSMTFLALTPEGHIPQTGHADGRYHSHHLAGLICSGNTSACKRLR